MRGSFAERRAGRSPPERSETRRSGMRNSGGSRTRPPAYPKGGRHKWPCTTRRREPGKRPPRSIGGRRPARVRSALYNAVLMLRRRRPPRGGRGGFNPGRVSPSRSMAATAAHLDLFSRLDRTHDLGAFADFTEERMELAYNALRSWKR